jgi:Ca-activated chloride channel family protein
MNAKGIAALGLAASILLACTAEQQEVAESGQPSAPPPAMPAAGLHRLTDQKSSASPMPLMAESRDRFQPIERNPIAAVSDSPVSTFSIDVDTASYSFVRRKLNQGVMPPRDAVRVEELINYFRYDYPLAENRNEPFRPSVHVVSSPWQEGNKLVHIGIKGYDIEQARKPRSNLVFLLDVSGSMNAPDKLPLVVNSMKLLLQSLDDEDTVGIVVYAGAAGTVLEPTPVSERRKIHAALDRLRAGGSTAGGDGIRLAYSLAQERFDPARVNRVILATDGDFNVGVSSPKELKELIEEQRDLGVYLTVLGFGEGNLNDHAMQALAQSGNGMAAHIDTLNEARKVLVDEASSTLFPIAKDVKIQVEFNPDTVAEYRLIGYETRALKREDFRNDKVDAGDIGAGHAVTAIYEITPKGSASGMIPETRYRHASDAAAGRPKFSGEYGFLKIRYKLPKEDKSRLISVVIPKAGDDTNKYRSMPDWPTGDVGWATAVAGFGQLLAGGTHIGTFGYADVLAMARENKGADEYGLRAEFINLVRMAQAASSLAMK